MLSNLVHLLWLLGPGLAQLLDTRAPLVYEDPQKDTAGRPTYFGYSVLLYSRKNYSWIQIGAPRSNCSALTGITEPGSVYRCGIAEPCKLLLMEQTGNEASSDYWDKKDGGWLGGTMAVHSAADRMVVCAHRWINQVLEYKIKDWFIHGACYTSKASDEDLIPLEVENRSALQIESNKLLPLLGNRNFTLPAWGKKYVFDYAMGQAGMSAYFTHDKHEPASEDDNPDKLQLVLGAPGILNWRGSSVLLTEHSFPSIVNKRDLHSKSREGTFDSGVIPFLLYTKGYSDGDYQGYSGTSGHFFSKSELLHVAGAPRGHNYMGRVAIYEFPEKTRQPAEIRQSLFGDSMGSYFGAALAAADLTGDGLDDLLVGAPYAKEPKVHIFLGNARGSLIAPRSGAQHLQLPQWGRFSRFGMSIATGDINQDGFADILIGAPEAEGCGGVAIYLGGHNGLRKSPHQTLVAEDIAPGLGLRGFGISIAPPVDVDGNTYPDVAVGAYLSGHAVLLRTRARAQITSRLVSMGRLLRNSLSLSIKACLDYSWNHTASSSINVSRILTVDTAFGRAFLHGSSPNSFTYNNTRMLTVGKEDCQILDISLKKDIQNFLDPIEITMNYTLLENYLPKNVMLISEDNIKGKDEFNSLIPVLDGEQETARLSVPFATDCGNDNICSSDLVVNAYFPNHGAKGFVLGSADSAVLEVTLRNKGEPAYLAQVKIFLMAPASLSRLPAVCRAEPTIVCNMNNPLRNDTIKKLRLEIDMRGVSATSKAGDHLEFIVEAITRSDEIQPNDNSFIVDLPLKVEARVAIAGKSLSDTYSYSISDNTSFIELVHFKHLYEVQKFGASPVEEVLLVVDLPYKYKYNGKEITFVQIYQPEGSQAGQPFSCTKNNFTYTQDDPSDEDGPLNHDILTNDDPYPNTVIKKAKRSVRSLSQQEFFKPLFSARDNNYELVSEGNEKKARIKREDKKPEVSLPANRTVYLSCKEPNVICHRIQCVIGPFRRPQHVARLLITMALNISVLKDTVMGVKDILVVRSAGSAAIMVAGGMGPQSAEEVRSVFIRAPFSGHVEPWIIALSVILGMLLLLIVAMGLVKAGFFERKKKEELEALKQAEATQEPADTEEVWSEENQDDKEEEVELKLDEK